MENKKYLIKALTTFGEYVSDPVSDDEALEVIQTAANEDVAFIKIPVNGSTTVFPGHIVKRSIWTFQEV